MKKIFLLISLVAMFLVPSVSQAAESSVAESNIVKQSSISPRIVYRYMFNSIPPKKFNGMTRIYYEYDSKNNVYIGLYR